MEVFDEEDARQTSFTPFRSPALDREDEDTVLLLSEYDLGIASKMPLFKERLSVAETSFLASRLPS